MPVRFRFTQDGDLLLAGEVHELELCFDSSGEVDLDRDMAELEFDGNSPGVNEVAKLFGIDALWGEARDIIFYATGDLVVPELIEDSDSFRIDEFKRLHIPGEIIEEGI